MRISDKSKERANIPQPEFHAEALKRIQIWYCGRHKKEARKSGH